MWIAQFSDLHLTRDGGLLYGRVDTWAAFRQALARLNACRIRPDLLLLSGDLAEAGCAATYVELRASLEGQSLPYALLPGNHDSRAEMETVFPECFAAWRGPAGRVDLPGGSLLLLDTAVPGQEWGRVDGPALAALEGLRRGPSLLAMHHPPFPVAIPGMDCIACRGDTEALGLWLGGRVEGLLCGHIHRQVATDFHGVPARVAPSTAHQIALDAPSLAYTLEPGGFLLHQWEPGRHLLTHWLPVEPAPVYPYDE